MLGEQIGETRGKRLVRRVLSTEPPTVEVTFEDSGQMFGVSTTGMGTYTSVISPDGSIFGHGEERKRDNAYIMLGRVFRYIKRTGRPRTPYRKGR